MVAGEGVERGREGAKTHKSSSTCLKRLSSVGGHCLPPSPTPWRGKGKRCMPPSPRISWLDGKGRSLTFFRKYFTLERVLKGGEEQIYGDDRSIPPLMFYSPTPPSILDRDFSFFLFLWKVTNPLPHYLTILPPPLGSINNLNI